MRIVRNYRNIRTRTFMLTWRCWRWVRRMLGPRARFGDPPELLAGGFAYFQALHSACELGLFDFLSAHPQSSREEISENMSVPIQSTNILLLTCASLGVLKVDPKRDTYSNSWNAEKRFVSRNGKPPAALEASHVLMYKALYNLTESLRKGTNVGLKTLPGSGETLYERLSSSSELERVFYEWMEALDPGGPPRPVVNAIRNSQQLLDVGGGSATVAISLAEQIEDLSVTIFDLTSSCEFAAARIERAGMSGRISTLPGNFIDDPFPTDADTILFAHIFNIYSAETNRQLICKAAKALPQGGKLIIYNIVSDDAGTGPIEAAFLSLYFHTLATGQGMVYPPKRYEPWFRDAGFSSLVIETETYQGIFIGTK